ncbi:hypothetical protein GUJ93_ZPchr0012g21729 [Zizania palustris]|nr:hypothetical protein GUJ93_ZPchr0012g21729 [Zizania palustris]
MTQEMEVEIMSCKAFAVLGNFFASGATLTALLGGVKFGYKLAGVELAVVPPSTLLSVLGLSYVTAIYTGMSMNYAILQAFPGFILEKGEERTKMELANIVINKHSDEKSLVEAVKRHFFAEHLFSDQYQDGPLFRWRLRHTYVDSAFMERVKEIEVNNSDDESGSISGQRTTNFVSLLSLKFMFKLSSVVLSTQIQNFQNNSLQDDSTLFCLCCRVHLESLWRTHCFAYWVLQTATSKATSLLIPQVISRREGR